jgi:UDP-GlcNAc:undecaprenyl-phosphate/decaprenyl-phosphate GlcNAc-1-phosphate transferase
MIVNFLLPLVISFLATYPTIYFARKYHLTTSRDSSPHPAHTHVGTLPRAGGIPILLAILICSIAFIPMSKVLFGILLSSTLMVIVGLFDDYFNLSPYLRFGLNITIISIAILFGLGIPFVSNPLGGVIRLDVFPFTFTLFGVEHTLLLIADIIAIIWLTWTTNSLNWSKGIDGQMSGFVAVAAVFIGLFADKTLTHSIEYTSVVTFCIIVAGAFVGFTYHNFYPQTILPGYSAGSLAGFLLGVLSIISFAKVGSFMFILAIPTIDALYTIIRRIAAKKSPFVGDRGHFHHRLLDLGWGRRRIAVFYWLVTYILGTTSLFLPGLEKLFAFLGIMVLMVLFILLIEHIKIEHKTYG